MNEEPLGYVCDRCGWWLARLDQMDPHCRHMRVHLPENMLAAEVEEAKRKAQEGIP